jgi:hypothetical protein
MDISFEDLSESRRRRSYGMHADSSEEYLQVLEEFIYS